MAKTYKDLGDNILKFGPLEVEHDGKFNNLTIIVPHTRVSFSQNGKRFFKPEDFMGKERYGATFIAEDEEIQDALLDIRDFLIDEHLDGNEPDDRYCAIVEGNTQKSKKGDKKGKVLEGYENNVIIKARKDGEEAPPQVFGQDQKIISKMPDRRILADGAYAGIQIRVFAYNKSNEGIGCDLDAVFYKEKGEPFSTGGSREVDTKALFKGHKATAVDPDDVMDRKRSRSKDEDEDEAPRSRSRSRSRDDDKDEDDEPRSRSRSRSRDEEEEDDAPRGRSRSRSRDEDDDDDRDDEPRGRSRSRDDDDDDDRPKERTRRRRD